MTKAAKSQEVDYQALRSELDDILVSLDDDSLGVEAMTQKYQRGMEIVKQLEDYLKSAENKVKKVKADWSAGHKN